MIHRDKAALAVADLLVALGVEEGEHTAGTPQRVAGAWAEALAGYDDDPARHLQRCFGGPADPGLVVVSGIRIASTCAHHLLPIMGVATVAYRPHPGDQIVGLSKLVRVVQVYARRLQVQERLGYQVAGAVQDCLAPIGAACVITAAHGCMAWRGVRDHDAVTTTQALSGDWRAEHPDFRSALVEHDAAARPARSRAFS
ncbi:GTP cyclohydrolase I [Kribbella sp. CA-293567]|uniref:GTP cyclohydrolase I n=1 Tax=Kribbella sp. CA-293567 TaxID=3002436 RepID=UPI0022DE549E|nr:GTP cyclohydrolase I [Kribbella sp. CA-293567]WBQ07613.1 GTP cyclohydrolase I [Kribbella sp. CA-293567]